MSKVSIKRLSEDVATLCGIPSDPGYNAYESPIPCLEERVRLCAPSILADLIMEAPTESLEDFKSFISSKISIAENYDNTATLTLPDDFLRLVSLKLSNWDVPVLYPSPLSEETLRRLRCRWSGAGYSSARPCVIYFPSPDGNLSMLLFPATSDSRLQIALYMPQPAPDAENCLYIPRTLYNPLIKRIMESLSKG